MRGDGKKIHSYLLTGGALLPEIPPGVIVRCAVREPRSGDFVVYLPNEGGEPIFRRYAERPDGQVLLESLNRLYDTYTTRKEEMLSRGTLWIVVSFHKLLREDADFSYEMPDPGKKREQSPAEPSESRSAPGVRDGEELLTFTEAGSVLKVKRTRLYAMLRNGELHAVKVGKLWRISRSSIEEYLSRAVYPGNHHRENHL